MKKLVNFILLTIAVSFVSCDFDKESPDSIPYSEAFKSMLNIEALERGAYSRLRTAYSPSSMQLPDLQADYVNPVYGFSNTYGPIYLWNFTQDDSDIASTWDYFYAAIGQCNFVIDGLKDNQKVEFTPTATEQATIDRIECRMHLMRALCYSVLAERFCADYDTATAGNQYTGVPILASHNPDAKEGRATLAKVYETILSDIEEARRFLKGQPGTPNATTLNIDCLTALEARVYLQMDNYEMALKRANALITSPTYSLVKTQKELEDMWVYDKSSEIIFEFYASKTELAFTWGSPFYSDYNGGLASDILMVPDYIPTQSCIDSFDDADWRKGIYFLDCEYSPTSMVRALIKGYTSLARKVSVISKYPGNPDLRTSAQWNYYNTFKVFRLAEMYLIAAEAAARDGGDAKTPLNTLRKQRGLTELDAVTLADVQAERYREMMMEGTRLTDLKRWGQGMTRGTEQSGYVIDSETGAYNEWPYITELAHDLSVTKDNYMFLWPIPASETFANPDIASQQNPGWIR